LTGWIVRDERPGDEAVIRRVTAAAFAGHPHSDGTEPAIVDALRTDGDLVLSLVAEAAGSIVGHVAVSPVALSNGDTGWLGLGPISVVPRFQRRGVGGALVEAAMARLRAADARGLVLVGSPDFYARFGFVRGTPLHLPGPLAEYFQVLAFTEVVPAASVAFAPGFSAGSPPGDPISAS
jgi:predicted N-acetyltransferase YhbS